LIKQYLVEVLVRVQVQVHVEQLLLVVLLLLHVLVVLVLDVNHQDIFVIIIDVIPLLVVIFQVVLVDHF
jgi:hypothetical protein